MQYIKHNDYEIIHLIKEGNQDALALMFDKYKNLISKKISKFNLVYDYDDAYQEALMILYKSIVKFDDRQLKSFTRFFEIISSTAVMLQRVGTRRLFFLTPKAPTLKAF